MNQFTRQRERLKIHCGPRHRRSREIGQFGVATPPTAQMVPTTIAPDDRYFERLRPRNAHRSFLGLQASGKRATGNPAAFFDNEGAGACVSPDGQAQVFFFATNQLLRSFNPAKGERQKCLVAMGRESCAIHPPMAGLARHNGSCTVHRKPHPRISRRTAYALAGRVAWTRPASRRSFY
jgi:hypothetical protein